MDEKILVHSANSPDVYHWGIHGQQWGKRRYQNEDGSLTPLGRVHYGVGQAREASKIKMREMKAETRNAVKLAKAQAKTAKAVAKAEAKKLEAEAKAYRDRKEADKMVELERIKNDRERIKNEREADKDVNKIEQAKVKNENEINKGLAESSRIQAENENKTNTALKVVGGVLAAAGIGYLLYRAAKGSSVTSEANVNVGENVIKKVSDKPVSEVANNTTSVTTKVNNTVAKVSQADKNLVNMTLGKGKKAATSVSKWTKKDSFKEKLIESGLSKEKANSWTEQVFPKYMPNKLLTEKANWVIEKIKEREGLMGHKDNDNMILVHSAKGADVYHYGIKGQRWGVITKKEDAPSSGRTKNVTGTTSGATVDKTTSYGGNGSKGRSENDEYLGKATAQTAALACYAVLTGKMTREQAVARMKRSSREQQKTWENVNGGWKKASEKIGNFDGDDLLKYDYDTFINKSVEKFNLMMDGINEPGNESLKKQIMDFGKRAEAINNRKNLTSQVKADQAKKSENAPKQYEEKNVKSKKPITSTSITETAAINKPKHMGSLSSNLKKDLRYSKVIPAPGTGSGVKTYKHEYRKLLNYAPGAKIRKLKHSDGQDFYLVHSEYGEDIEQWGIKGQRWGVRRWQYEDGSLTPEGRIHYGRISEKGQQEGKFKGAVAKGNTRIYNQLNRRMSRNAEKYEKTGKRKYAEKALENAEWMNDENYVKKQGKLSADMYYAHLLAGLPGQIITGAVHSKDMADVNQTWKDTKAKFQNMSLDELDKAFKETIGKTEKVKFNAKEMDKETKAKEDERRVGEKANRSVEQETKDLEKGLKEVKQQEVDSAYKRIKDADLWTEEEVSKGTDKKRSREAADLGLKALNKIGRQGYDEKQGITNDDRAWFVYEDQTIGLATIADLVNRGKTKSEIKSLMRDADLMDESDDTHKHYENGVFQLSWENGGYDRLEPFIDACIEVKKDEEKKRG